MRIRIQLSKDTIKELFSRREQALARGDRRPLQHITALLLLDKLQFVPEVAALLEVGVSSVYAWMADFMARGCVSLRYRRSHVPEGPFYPRPIG